MCIRDSSQAAVRHKSSLEGLVCLEANDLLLTDPEERELRYRAQRSALRNCRKLIHHIELAHEILSGFSDDAFAYWAKMAAGVKNQTAKWYKTDKERAAKLDAQKRHQ